MILKFRRSPQTCLSSIMRPITIVKSFLKGDTPSIPLPPSIDDELTSNPSTGSWLLVSQSPTQSNHMNSTKEVECQTSPSEQALYHRPRACAKRFFGLSTDAPASVPSFAPKSKLPKLNYGGLQAPQLHCFAISLQSNSSLHTPQSVQYLKPNRKSLPSPASFRKASTMVQPTSDKDASEAERARPQLRAIFYEIQFSSKLFCEIHNSEFLDQRIDRVADSLGTGGLLAHMQIWNHWACWCQCHMQMPAEAPLSLLLDFLHASDHLKRRKDSKPSRTGMVTHIKALRWMALKLDLPRSVALHSQTVSDFLKSQTRIPFERSEA